MPDTIAPDTVTTSSVTITAATRADAAELAAMMDAFNVEDGQAAGLHTVEGVLRDAFGPAPAFAALIARQGGAAIGYAATCLIYNSEIARQGLWLADLWIAPAYRSRGIGRKLMAAVAKVARDQDCGCIWWGVRNINDRGKSFYISLGAVDDDARFFGLDADAIAALAAAAD